MAGFLKKLAGKGLGLLGKAVSNTGLPGASAAAKLVGKVQAKVDPKKASTSNSKSAALAKTPTVATRSAAQSSPNSGSGGGGMIGNLIAKAKAWMQKMKTENPIVFWIVVGLIVIFSSVLLWLLWKMLVWIYRKITGKRGTSTGRRILRPKSTQARATVPSAPRSGKRRASAAQLAALARGRAALKRKRKR